LRSRRRWSGKRLPRCAPARFEELYIEGKRIIVDGAHNPQKMSAFMRSLKKKHPGMKFDILTGFKKGKDYAEMFRYIVPVAHRIFVSEFEKDDQIDDVYPEPMIEIKRVLKDKYGFEKVVMIQNSKDAFDKARKAKNGPVVVTGSLYLISDLYKKFNDMIERARGRRCYREISTPTLKVYEISLNCRSSG
jgi:dihydrofolate synthase/folylpolyglutamate synthase